MRADMLHIGVAAYQPGERRVLLCVAVDIQPLIGQVADAGRNAKARQVLRREQMIGKTRRIGIVFLNA